MKQDLCIVQSVTIFPACDVKCSRYERVLVSQFIYLKAPMDANSTLHNLTQYMPLKVVLYAASHFYHKQD